MDGHCIVYRITGEAGEPGRRKGNQDAAKIMPQDQSVTYATSIRHFLSHCPWTFILALWALFFPLQLPQII